MPSEWFLRKLKARLIAASLSPREASQLKNTVLILRRSGVQLDHYQEERCKEFEAVVQAYQEAHGV
jgi:hypothetical protein